MFVKQITDEVELRMLEMRHVEELYAVYDRNREYLRRWLTFVDGTTLESAQVYRRQCLQKFIDNGAFDSGIWFCGQFAGCIGIQPIDWKNRCAEIGYWLGQEYQGHGIMTMAAHAVVDHLLGTLNLHRVVISASAENLRSRAVAERLGFRLEAVHQQAGWYYDHYEDRVVYAMLQEEWLQRKSLKQKACQ